MREMRPIYIYTLSHNDDIRYIGRTFNIKKRFNQHINSAKNSNSYKSNWIKKVKNITIDVIDICSNEDYSFWEQHYISLYKSWGFNLLNMTLGGEGMSGYKPSKESNLKRSIRMKGNGNHFFGKKHTQETKNILSDIDRHGSKNSMYNKKHKPETIEILSKIKSGIYDGIKNPRAKKLYQYDITNNFIKTWNYAKECADFYGISRGNLSTFSKHNTNIDVTGIGKYKILTGFIFKFH